MLIVIKIGSNSISSALKRLPKQLKKLLELHNVILVSSGAIAHGMQALELSSRPPELSRKQALAAIGQPILMQRWAEALKAEGISTGQVLVTHHDINKFDAPIIDTLKAMLSYGVVPIINENDTVSAEEIKIGDNDTLGAAIFKLIGADQYWILTNVEGFKIDDKVVPQLNNIDASHFLHATDTTSSTSVGGMKTKLQAMQLVLQFNKRGFIGSVASNLEDIPSESAAGSYFY